MQDCDFKSRHVCVVCFHILHKKMARNKSFQEPLCMFDERYVVSVFIVKCNYIKETERE